MQISIHRQLLHAATCAETRLRAERAERAERVERAESRELLLRAESRALFEIKTVRSISCSLEGQKVRRWGKRLFSLLPLLSTIAMIQNYYNAITLFLNSCSVLCIIRYFSTRALFSLLSPAHSFAILSQSSLTLSLSLSHTLSMHRPSLNAPSLRSLTPWSRVSRLGGSGASSGTRCPSWGMR